MWNEIILSGFADEIDSNLDKQIEVLKKLDMNYLEMRGVNGKGLVEYSLSEVKEFRHKLDEAGISLSCVGSPIGKIGITDAFAPHMELFRHTVETAHVMGTANIRIFSFFMPSGEAYESYRGKVIEQVGRFVDYAGENDVILLHENEKEIYGDIASRCRDLMEIFYGNHFKAVFDFANFVQCRQDTLEAYDMLKQYVAYVHIKDALWDNGSVVPAGRGDGRLEEILRLMKDGGYQGFLSLEPHLSDFEGFSELEQNAKKNHRLNGEEAFVLAHTSLKKILEKI